MAVFVNEFGAVDIDGDLIRWQGHVDEQRPLIWAPLPSLKESELLGPVSEVVYNGVQMCFQRFRIGGPKAPIWTKGTVTDTLVAQWYPFA